MSFAGGEKASRARSGRQLWQAQYRHRRAFHARPAVLRFPEFLRAAAAARAARQGGALSRAARHFLDEKKNEKEEWYYEDGLTDYLLGATDGYVTLPASRLPAASAAATRRGLGGAVASGGRRADHRVLRQPDSHGPGRHPRQRNAHRAAGCHARFLRAALPAAPRRQADAGRHLGALRLRAVVQARGSRSSPARPRSA
jgi:hypothetical protein